MRSISYPRRAALLLIAVLGLAGLGACTPEQVALFQSLSPEDQGRVVAELQRQQAERPRDCYTAMEQVFPAYAHGWARGIIHRESRNNPSAQNRSSTAAGCFQLLSSLHAGRYTAAGCHVSQWADPVCNTRAAYELFKVAGTSPWRL